MDWLRLSSWGTAPSVARSLPVPAALASAVMKSSGVVLAETSMGEFNFNILDVLVRGIEGSVAEVRNWLLLYLVSNGVGLLVLGMSIDACCRGCAFN